MKKLLLVFEEGNFAPFFNVYLSVLSFEKIVTTFVIDLKIASIQFVLDEIFSLLNEIENLSESSWNYSPFFPQRSTTRHGVRFTTTCLAISKNSAIVTVKEILYDWCRHFGINILLRTLGCKHFLKKKLVTLLQVANAALVSL